MSNKVVPTTYRAIIDDVIHNIRGEFDEFGVSEDVLEELQSKWEKKVITSHVADFEASQPAASTTSPSASNVAGGSGNPQSVGPTTGFLNTPHTTNGSTGYYSGNPYISQLHHNVKTEPRDGSSYLLSAGAGAAAGGPPHFSLPPLPGPQLTVGSPANAGSPPGKVQPPGPGLLAFPMPQLASVGSAASQSTSSSSTPRIPQLDGTFADDDDDDKSPTALPRPNHPSLPSSVQLRQQQQSGGASTDVDPEAINSDLDDSDTENEVDDGTGEGGGDEDIVYCTYDKVARVKNKWKTTLTHGMVHLKGKDYLFHKCNGEFEW